MYRLAFVFLLLAVAATGCRNASSSDDAVVEEGFELKTVDAASFTEELEAIDADIRIVNVWATWCGPCHVEMPEFVRLANEMADEGVAVRFLSIDDIEHYPQVEAFVENYKITGPTYFSGTGDRLITTIYPDWQFGLPTTFMIDRDMAIRDVWEGAVTYDFLVAKVERMRGILAEIAETEESGTPSSQSTES